MSTDAPQPESIAISNNTAGSRYEIRVGDALAGFAEYHLRPGRITFTHTEIGDEFEGKGIGSRLAAAALDGAGADGLLVTPLCPFIAAYIRRHPEYLDIVDPAANFH
jgi:predicted GNAT family acetyltransferase